VLEDIAPLFPKRRSGVSPDGRHRRRIVQPFAGTVEVLDHDGRLGGGQCRGYEQKGQNDCNTTRGGHTLNEHSDTPFLAFIDRDSSNTVLVLHRGMHHHPAVMRALWRIGWRRERKALRLCSEVEGNITRTAPRRIGGEAPECGLPHRAAGGANSAC
jgi:hypothetical protein